MSAPKKDRAYMDSVRDTFAAASPVLPVGTVAQAAQPTVPSPVLDPRGNAAYVHKLKCWSENFDAIVSGGKVCEVRAEEDRKFKAGDALELTRTDREGKATEPLVRLVVEITHVERHAGPLDIVASKPADGTESTKLIPVCVLSLSRRGALHTYDPPTSTKPAVST